MLAPDFRPLPESDLPALLRLMKEFYLDQQMHFDREIASATVTQLLRHPQLGSVMLIFVGDKLAGYFVLTFCFSLEFHGRWALLDELYVLPPFQRQGIGHAVIALAQSTCRKEKIPVLRLEVGHGNPEAQALYRDTGFKAEPRYLMTMWLTS